ncbi:MAG: cytochrome c [Methylococcales bacterium]
MNKIFHKKLRMMLFTVMFGGFVLSLNQAVFAEPFEGYKFKKHKDKGYKIKKNVVDKATFNGWNVYRKQACGTCHGSTGVGSAGYPNLLHVMKSLTKDKFSQVLIEGRGIMYSFRNNKAVVDGIDDLYVYLKGRSDGVIPAGDLTVKK